VAGITSDRLFPLHDQKLIADHLGTAGSKPGAKLIGGKLQVIESPYGHDGFLIEDAVVGPMLTELLDS
jgi:homoserine O-acetyltransferase